MVDCCALLWKIARRNSIESHLAHAVRIEVAVAYNRTGRFECRRTPMDQWTSYLDGAAGGTVVSLGRHGGRTNA